MRRVTGWFLLLSSLVWFEAAPRTWAGGAVYSMPDGLPELEQRESWQQSLDDLAAAQAGAPPTWLVFGPVADPGRKQFEQRGSLEAERSDDWGALQTTLWARPQDEDGSSVDLGDILRRKSEGLVFVQTQVDWPVGGPALLWFESAARALVYVNNSLVEHLQPYKRIQESGRGVLYPIPVQMLQGRNTIKLKLARGDDRRGLLGFHLRLERNDLGFREQLLRRLCELYPLPSAGWRGAEAQLELARRYEEAGRTAEALAAYGKVSAESPDNEDYAAEVREARRRLAPDGARDATPPNASAIWQETEERFGVLLAAAETTAADALARDFAARFPFAADTGTALCLRGILRQDYAASLSCQPFFERALREFPQNETVRKYALRGVAYARNYRPEAPEVAVNHERQLAVDAVRRQLEGGNEADIVAAVHSVDLLMRTSGGSLLRVDDSQFTPRYVGLREYLRALLAHLAGEPLALYRQAMARGAEEHYREARSHGGTLDLEAMAWEHYLTPAAARALNHSGNLYLDNGAYAQAAAVFRMLLRDYGTARPSSTAGGAPAAPTAPDGGGPGTLLGGLSEPLIMAKLARALLLDGQITAAREMLSRLRAAQAKATLKLGGRTISAGEYAFNVESKIAWATLGAAREIAVLQTETFGGSMRRTGPAAYGPAPTPGGVAWSGALAKSAAAESAQRYWPEDSVRAHWQPYPAISGGRAVVSALESVNCFDLDSGQLLWRQAWNSSGSLWHDKFTGFPISCPTAASDRIHLRVLVGHESGVRCLRASDGKVLWSSEISPALKKTVWLSDPLIAYGLAIAVYLEEPAEAEGAGRGGVNVHGVAALDAETGDLRWKRPLARGVTGIRVSEDGNRSRDNKQYAMYRGSMQLGPPAADGGVIYSATGLGSLAALNAFTGEVLWLAGYPRMRSEDLKAGNSGASSFLPRMLKLNARGPCSPVVGEDVVVLMPKDAAGVIGFDRKSGQIRWSRELLDSRFLAGLCDGNAIAADNTVTAVSLATGKVAWEYSLGNRRLLAQPGYSGGMLYLPTVSNVQLLDARTGTALAAYAWDSKVGPLGNLVITGQRIVGVNGKYVAALGAK